MQFAESDSGIACTRACCVHQLVYLLAKHGTPLWIMMMPGVVWPTNGSHPGTMSCLTAAHINYSVSDRPLSIPSNTCWTNGNSDSDYPTLPFFTEVLLLTNGQVLLLTCEQVAQQLERCIAFKMNSTDCNQEHIKVRSEHCKNKSSTKLGSAMYEANRLCSRHQ
jgi:hypothetical protein